MSFLLQQKITPTMVHPSFDPFSTDIKKIRATGFDDTDFFHAFDAGFTELMRAYVTSVDVGSILTMSLSMKQLGRNIGDVIEEAFEDISKNRDEFELHCVQLFYTVIEELRAVLPGASMFLDGVAAPDELSRLDKRNLDNFDWEQEGAL
jgi:hypothetical protein